MDNNIKQMNTNIKQMSPEMIIHIEYLKSIALELSIDDISFTDLFDLESLLQRTIDCLYESNNRSQLDLLNNYNIQDRNLVLRTLFLNLVLTLYNIRFKDNMKSFDFADKIRINISIDYLLKVIYDLDKIIEVTHSFDIFEEFYQVRMNEHMKLVQKTIDDSFESNIVKDSPNLFKMIGIFVQISLQRDF